MAPSSRSVTVSKPACGCGSPTVRSPMSRWSSMSRMNGSLRRKSSGDTTCAAKCPGPTNPGASGGTVTTRAIRRCGFMVTSVDTVLRIGFELVIHVRKKSIDGCKQNRHRHRFALCSRPWRETAQRHKHCEHEKDAGRDQRLVAAHVVANCQQHDG